MAIPTKKVSIKAVYLDDVVLNSGLVAIEPTISLFGKVFSCVAVCHDRIAAQELPSSLQSCHPTEQVTTGSALWRNSSSV